jgi:hypothetical protein
VSLVELERKLEVAKKDLQRQNRETFQTYCHYHAVVETIQARINHLLKRETSGFSMLVMPPHDFFLDTDSVEELEKKRKSALDAEQKFKNESFKSHCHYRDIVAKIQAQILTL